MVRFLLCFLLVGFFAGDAGADIYSSTASDGSVVFTNTPYKKADRVVIKKRNRPADAARAKEGVQLVSLNTSAKPAAVKSPATSEKPMPVHARKAAYSGFVEEKAKKHNVDPKLVKSVIRAESNWNHRAVSPKGAMGLMQLMPGTASLMGVNNPFDPEQNIEGGVKYLRHLLTRFNGNLTMAIAAYNAGPKTVERKGGVPAIQETVTYVQRVMGDYTGVMPMASIPLSIGSMSTTRIHKVVLKDGSILYKNM
jgi:soluble lytic murein transglycosylase-like protein